MAADSLEAPAATNVVRLTVAASEAEARELEAIARELLARLELKVDFRRVESIARSELRQPSTDYFARVWITLGQDGHARLYLEHSAQDRLLRRDVAGDPQNPELAREELGHILQATLEGLQAGEEIGAPRQEALAAEEEAPAVGPSKPHVIEPGAAARAPGPQPRAFRVGPRYEIVLLGDGGVFEDGPGAVFGFLLPSSQRWGMTLMASYHRPFRVERDEISARFQSWTIAGELTLDAHHGAGWALRLGAGVAASLVKVTPATSANDVELAESAWRKLALGRASLTYSRRVTSSLAVEAALGAELDPSGSRYVLRAGDGERELLAPWAARPLLSLGVTVP